MSHIQVGESRLELNEEGFLLNPEEWSEEVARVIAHEEEQIEELTELHWKVIHFIRNHYLENEMAPMIRLMCKGTDLKLKEIYALFPSGPAKGAVKIAGLPKPDGCV